MWWQHVGSLLEIHDWYCADVPDLLSEVDRLRAMVRDFNTALVAKQEEMDSLASHYVEIRDENQTLRYNYYGLRDTVFHLRARVARLKGVLRSVEWTECQMDSALPRFCPECQERYPERGTPSHGPYCRLDAALNAGTPGPNVPAATAP